MIPEIVITTIRTTGKIFIFYDSGLTMFNSGPTTSPTPTSHPLTQPESYGLIVALALLLVLCILWITLELCWRHRCCCPAFWSLRFWSFVFCDCFCKGSGYFIITAIVCTYEL